MKPKGETLPVADGRFASSRQTAKTATTNYSPPPISEPASPESAPENGSLAVAARNTTELEVDKDEQQQRDVRAASRGSASSGLGSEDSPPSSRAHTLSSSSVVSISSSNQSSSSLNPAPHSSSANKFSSKFMPTTLTFPSSSSSSSSRDPLTLRGSAGPPSRMRRVLLVSLLAIGLIVCVTSSLSLIMLPTFVANQVSKRLVLKNNSMLLERWSRPTVPMLFKVWLFNVENPKELLERRETKPRLREVGPFVFRLQRRKDVASFAGDNLLYTERRLYHFEPDLSCCAINTSVTIPNVPLMAVVDRALGYNLPLLGRFVPRLINRAVQSLREQLFVRRQARELLFEGYDVELLKMIARVGSFVGLSQMSHRFAIFRGKNDTWRPEQDGVWAINTGARDRRLFGRVTSWNSYRKLPFWNSDECNAINGSDGTLFAPPILASEPLQIFNPELCRTVQLKFAEPSRVHSIEAFRFQLNPLNFARTRLPSTTGARSAQSLRASRQRAPATPSAGTNTSASSRPEARPARSDRLGAPRESAASRAPALNPFLCFCDRRQTHLNGVNVCEFDGLIDLSKCSKQAQVIFGSMPHFHQSDPRLLAQVSGLAPNASRHTTYLDIEPNTGLVLGGKRRVQLNLLVKHNKEVEGFENINDMLVPLLWFEESAQIPEETAHKFKSLYTDRIQNVRLVLFTILLASLALLVVDGRLIMAAFRERRHRSHKLVTPGLPALKEARKERRPSLSPLASSEPDALGPHRAKAPPCAPMQPLMGAHADSSKADASEQ